MTHRSEPPEHFEHAFSQEVDPVLVIRRAESLMASDPELALWLLQYSDFLQRRNSTRQVPPPQRLVDVCTIQPWAERSGYGFMRDTEAVGMRVPRNLDAFRQPWKIALGLIAESYRRPYGIAVGENVRMIGWAGDAQINHQYWVFSHDWHMLHHEPLWLKLTIDYSRFFDEVNSRTIVDLRREGAPIQEQYFDETVILLGGSSNFSHFMVDSIANLWSLRKLPNFSRYPIVLQKLAPWQRDVLAELYVANPIIELEPKGSCFRAYRFRKAIVPSGLPIPEAYHRLRQMFGVDAETRPASPGGEAIFLTRGSASHGRIDNEDEVVSYLKEQGVAIVDPANLTVREKIEIIGGARLVITPSGSGITNFPIFASATARLLSFMPQWWVENTVFDQIIGGLVYVLPYLERTDFVSGKHRSWDDSIMPLNNPSHFPMPDVIGQFQKAKSAAGL